MTAQTYEDALAEVCAMDAPLVDRLAAYTQVLRTFAPSYAEACDELIAGFNAARIGNSAPQVGATLPDFMLPDQDGRLAQLSELLRDGPLVVSFNRGHWCPYCELELDTYAAAHELLAAKSVGVVSIMPERREYLLRMRAKHGPAIRFLCDMDNSYALELGLVLWVGERIRALMLADGLDLARFHGNDMWFLPVPATFVVGRDGVVRARHVDPDFRNRAEIDVLLAQLERA